MRHAPLLLILALGACESGTDTTDDTDVDTDDTEVATSACDDLASAPAGTICTQIGMMGVAQYTADGEPADKTGLYLPIDTEIAPDGTVFFIDWNNHRVRYLDADGLARTVAGTGTIGDGPEGPGTLATLNHPTNLAFNPANEHELYIAAWHNSRIEKVDLVTGNLSFECGTGARAFGGDGGDAKVAKLDLPAGLVFDEDGSILFSDAANQILRRIDDSGVITTIAGTLPTVDAAGVTTARATGWSGDGGPALGATFNMGWGQKGYPAGRIARLDRTLYVADSYNHVIRTVDLDAGTVAHFAGTGTSPGFAGDGGDATTAQMNFPTDLEVLEDGTVYVADTWNSCVRKIDPDGVITTVAGVCGEPGADGDGGPATDAHLFNPYGVEVGNGLLWIADTENQVIRVVKL